MTELRWGIMGTGGIAAAMAGALDAAGSPIAAVGSARPGAAATFADRWGIPIVAPDHAGVARVPEVDVVYVATTNDRHLDNVLACVEVGVPVLCEKPIALDALQADAMFSAARRSGVLVVEGMWMRFLPHLERVHELIDGGAIGDLRQIEATLSYFVNTDPGRRWSEPGLGGGALVDLGVYPLSLIHHLAGPPLSFEASARLSPSGVDLASSVVSLHTNDVMATATSTFDADTANEATVSGTEGRIRLPSPMHHPSSVVVERRDEVAETYDTGYAGHGFQFEIAHMEQCVRDGLVESPLRPHEDTLAVMRWMDAIRSRIGVSFDGSPPR